MQGFLGVLRRWTSEQPSAMTSGRWAKWRQTNIFCQSGANNIANLMSAKRMTANWAKTSPELKKHLNFMNAIKTFMIRLTSVETNRLRPN